MPASFEETLAEIKAKGFCLVGFMQFDANLYQANVSSANRVSHGSGRDANPAEALRLAFVAAQERYADSMAHRQKIMSEAAAVPKPAPRMVTGLSLASLGLAEIKAAKLAPDAPTTPLSLADLGLGLPKGSDDAA